MQSLNREKIRRALIRVDIQNSFMPADPAISGTGELPVAGAPDIVPVVNKLSASPFFDLIIDTQDYHPADHGSFYTMHAGARPFAIADLAGLKQVLWPPHCRQGTPGCRFYPALDRTRVDLLIQKGMDRDVDSYSGFWDNGRHKSTGLADFLRASAAGEVYVVGITRPLCVSYTAKDAVAEGFRTYLLADACSLLTTAAGDDEKDLDDLKQAGVQVIASASIV